MFFVDNLLKIDTLLTPCDKYAGSCMGYSIPRTILIINLAVSDLLTAFTIPLPAMDAFMLHWPLADESLMMCRSDLADIN